MVAVPDDTAAFRERLDLTGTSVEGVLSSGAELDDIVVGHILTREKHPNADTLWVTTVDVGINNLDEDGNPAPLQVVCGAQNFEAGDKVPVALVGATMPDGTVIKKAKLRGIPSMGMNCSGKELGISDDRDGLLILPPDALIGQPIGAHLNLSDTIFDLEITPNRPDCMSMLGIAREVGALYDTDVTYQARSCAATGKPVEELVEVSIDDPLRCPRYTARVIKGVKIGPSPAWLVERIVAAGARSINNIVDVTNYILFELGQPLHVFDLDSFEKDASGRAHIVVRGAHADESFVTLDSVKRTLTKDMTVIADGHAGGDDGMVVALAGVMGGLDSEIGEDTVNVLLESAAFSNAHTSRTSRNLQLFSESSQRYERGVDPNTCDRFSAIAAALIVEVAGGELCSGSVDVYPEVRHPVKLCFRVHRFCALMGASVPEEEIITILTRLGCDVTVHTDNDRATGGAYAPVVLDVVVPTFRPDLTREIDLYEEVIRIWGMDRVSPTLPGGRGRIGSRTHAQIRTARIGETLRACGLNETMTYSFCAPDDLQRLRMPEEGRGEPVELINPMNSEQSEMRRSIIPGLLHSIAYNQSRGVVDVHLYEIGTVFSTEEGRKQPYECRRVAGVLAGSFNELGWNQPRVELGFFDGKGIIENLLRELNVSKVRFKAVSSSDAPWLQPGRGVEIYAAKRCVGWLGEIHPLSCKDFDVAAPVTAFELDLEGLLAVSEKMRPYKAISQFPAVSVDLALVVDESITAERIEQVIVSAGGKMLDTVRLFDVYRDSLRVGKGKKSLAFTLTYRADDRTLATEEVEKVHEKVVRKLCGATGGEVRGY